MAGLQRGCVHKVGQGCCILKITRCFALANKLVIHTKSVELWDLESVMNAMMQSEHAN